MIQRRAKHNRLYNVEIYPKLSKKNKPNTPAPKKNEIHCGICCEKINKIKFINCRLKGVQPIDFGKYGRHCKDKPICFECRTLCRESCPYCRNHTLYNISKVRYNTKKPPFVEREKKRLKKLLLKVRKREREEKLEKKRLRELRLKVEKESFIHVYRPYKFHRSNTLRFIQ
jgi:hypothetical protein|tara:strand:- start:323 stop:835 length:513 start_codon:yes stop_codon:yes gene_type:complete